MKLLVTTLAATALTGLAMIHSAEARCFWNGFDMECHYPARPHVYREVIEREVEAPPVIYRDWR